MKNQNLQLESINTSFRSESTTTLIPSPFQSQTKFRSLYSEEDLLQSLKEKPTFSKNAIYRLLQYTKKEIRLLILGQVFLLINAGSQVAIPYISGQFLDIVTKETADPMNSLKIKAMAFILTAILLVVSNFVKLFIDNIIAERVSIAMKSSLFRSLINNDVSFYDNKKTGELLSRLGSDIATVKGAASNNFSMVIRNIIVCIGSFVLLFTISWQLALYISLVIPLFASLSVFFRRAHKQLIKSYQDTIANGSIIAEEAFSNIRVVKSFSTEDKESEHFESIMGLQYRFQEISDRIFDDFFGYVDYQCSHPSGAMVWRCSGSSKRNDFRRINQFRILRFIFSWFFFNGCVCDDPIGHSIGSL